MLIRKKLLQCYFRLLAISIKIFISLILCTFEYESEKQVLVNGICMYNSNINNSECNFMYFTDY